MHDAVVLLDTDSFFKEVLGRLKERLAKLGAKRMLLGEDNWYWVLKPDVAIGEVVGF